MGGTERKNGADTTRYGLRCPLNQLTMGPEGKSTNNTTLGGGTPTQLLWRSSAG